MTQTFPGTVLGYRVWNVRHAGKEKKVFLAPMIIDGHGAFDVRWHPGINKARCMRDLVEQHDAPARSCNCGFYAFHKLWRAPAKLRHLDLFGGRSDHIVGAIAGCGDTQIHPTGFRAEQAQVIALLNNKRNPYCRRLATEYGVPLFHSRRQLKRFARQKSNPLPKMIRPKLHWYDNEDFLALSLAGSVLAALSCVLLQPLAVVLGSSLLAAISTVVTLTIFLLVCIISALWLRL